MKRNRAGTIVHRDNCPRARTAPRWGWADGMSDEELFARILAYPWLSLCKGCFGGTAEELALKSAAEAVSAP